MDGTLIDSTAGVVGAWHTFKLKYPTLDVTEILNSEQDLWSIVPWGLTPSTAPVF